MTLLMGGAQAVCDCSKTTWTAPGTLPTAVVIRVGVDNAKTDIDVPFYTYNLDDTAGCAPSDCDLTYTVTLESVPSIATASGDNKKLEVQIVDNTHISTYTIKATMTVVVGTSPSKYTAVTIDVTCTITSFTTTYLDSFAGIGPYTYELGATKLSQKSVHRTKQTYV